MSKRVSPFEELNSNHGANTHIKEDAEQHRHWNFLK